MMHFMAYVYNLRMQMVPIVLRSRKPGDPQLTDYEKSFVIGSPVPIAPEHDEMDLEELVKHYPAPAARVMD